MVYLVSVLCLVDQIVKSWVFTGADTAFGVGKVLEQHVFFRADLGSK
jgi:hypothetical protein